MIELMEQLKRMCHHKDCGQIRECPQKHTKCNKRLNIRTSIIWYASDLIWIVQSIADVEMKNLQNGIKELKECSKKLSIILHIFARHEGEEQEVVQILRSALNRTYTHIKKMEDQLYKIKLAKKGIKKG
jgi:hypothetical protein